MTVWDGTSAVRVQQADGHRSLFHAPAGRAERRWQCRPDHARTHREGKPARGHGAQRRMGANVIQLTGFYGARSRASTDPRPGHPSRNRSTAARICSTAARNSVTTSSDESLSTVNP